MYLAIYVTQFLISSDYPSTIIYGGPYIFPTVLSSRSFHISYHFYSEPKPYTYRLELVLL